MGFIESLEGRQHLNADISAPFDGDLHNPEAVGNTLYAQLWALKGGHGVKVAAVDVKTGRRFLVDDVHGKTMEFGSNVLIKNVQNHAIIRDENRLWIVDEGAEQAQPLFIDPKPFDDTPAQVVFFHGKSLTFAARSNDGARLFAPTSDDLRHAVIDFAKLDAHTRISSVTPWQDELIIQLSDGAIFRSDGSQRGTTRLRGFSGPPVIVGDRLLLSHVTNNGSDVIVTRSDDLKPERSLMFSTLMTEAVWASSTGAIIGFGSDYEWLDLTAKRAADIVTRVPKPLNSPVVFNGSLFLLAETDGWVRIDKTAVAPVKLTSQPNLSVGVYSDGQSLYTEGRHFTIKNGKYKDIYFEVWRSDGTPAGTKMIAKSNHGVYIAGGLAYYLAHTNEVADHFSVLTAD